MKKLRRIVVDTDPETGDVSYFKAGPSSRHEALAGVRAPKPPTKGQKARRKRQHREKYAGCRPRPLFHTPVGTVEPAERWSLKQEVLKRDGYRCQCCGSRVQLTLDHIIPRSRGGGWHLENLQTLCEPCNTAKADLMPYEQAA